MFVLKIDAWELRAAEHNIRLQASHWILLSSVSVNVHVANSVQARSFTIAAMFCVLNTFFFAVLRYTAHSDCSFAFSFTSISKRFVRQLFFPTHRNTRSFSVNIFATVVLLFSFSVFFFPLSVSLVSLARSFVRSLFNYTFLSHPDFDGTTDAVVQLCSVAVIDGDGQQHGIAFEIAPNECVSKNMKETRPYLFLRPKTKVSAIFR